MKRGSFTGAFDVHKECWELLPWIANERAAAKDVALVEAHLRECGECQQELQAQRRLREVIRTEESIVLAPQTSLQKLMQRIEDEPAVERADSRAPAQLRSSRSRWSRWLPIAAAVQGIAITALLGALWIESQETLTAPRFTTLTSPGTLVRGSVLRVVFADNVTLDEVNEILRSIDAQVVAGPSEAGVYTLGLSSRTALDEHVADALAQLRSDTRVLFSESAVAQPESP
jgi:hypothetical protein